MLSTTAAAKAPPLGPEELRRLDVERARRDPNYRGVALEAVLWRLWFRFSKWALGQGKTKRKQRTSGQWQLKKLTWEARR